MFVSAVQEEGEEQLQSIEEGGETTLKGKGVQEQTGGLNIFKCFTCRTAFEIPENGVRGLVVSCGFIFDIFFSLSVIVLKSATIFLVKVKGCYSRSNFHVCQCLRMRVDLPITECIINKLNYRVSHQLPATSGHSKSKQHSFPLNLRN